MTQDLYFIAIVPPQPIRDEVKAMKELIASRFHSKKALNSPPHITLFRPVRCDENRAIEIFAELKDLVSIVIPFELTLHGFGYFSNRVIYIRPEPSSELTLLEKRISGMQTLFQEGSLNNQPYRPHMTIGFRDLTPVMFDAAWNRYKGYAYHRQWFVDSVHMLKHNGTNWEEWRRVQLQMNLEE